MTTLRVSPISAFSDNYIWLLQSSVDARAAAVVDPGDAAPVLERLAQESLELEAILLTHHHPDHVGGAAELVERTGARVFAPARERMPVEVQPMADGDRARLTRLQLDFGVLDIPGHTAGHIAYFGHGALFCGDTLFSGGCGRLFEGTAEQMLASLDTLCRLPDETRAYCGHEYTLSNLRFATVVDPDNVDIKGYLNQATQLRQREEPTLPSTLGLEKRVNPFLRCRTGAVRRAAEQRAQASLETPTEVFAEIRRWKDGFR